MARTFLPGKSLQVGGRVISEAEFTGGTRKLKILVGNDNGNGPGYSSVVDTDVAATSTTFYQVPASKQFRVLGIRLLAAGSGNPTMTFGYGDNTQGPNSGTQPSNANYPGGLAQNMLVAVPGGTFAITEYGMEGDFIIPTGKYPFVRNNTTASGVTMFLIGIEEDA